MGETEAAVSRYWVITATSPTQQQATQHTL